MFFDLLLSHPMDRRHTALLVLGGCFLRKILKEIVGRFTGTLVLVALAFIMYRQYTKQREQDDAGLRAVTEAADTLAQKMRQLQRKAGSIKLPVPGTSATRGQYPTLYPPTKVRRRATKTVCAPSSSISSTTGYRTAATDRFFERCSTWPPVSCGLGHKFTPGNRQLPFSKGTVAPGFLQLHQNQGLQGRRPRSNIKRRACKVSTPSLPGVVEEQEAQDVITQAVT